MMIVSSPASSTRRNAGNEAVKVLKTHLPKVINELLCEPTVDDVLDHMHRDLLEIGVEDFGVFRFTYEGLPLEKWLLGARVQKGKVARQLSYAWRFVQPVRTAAFSQAPRSKARCTGFDGLAGWLDRAGGNQAIGVDDRKLFSIFTALQIERLDRLVVGAIDMNHLARI